MTRISLSHGGADSMCLPAVAGDLRRVPTVEGLLINEFDFN